MIDTYIIILVTLIYNDKRLSISITYRIKKFAINGKYFSLIYYIENTSKKWGVCKKIVKKFKME